MKHWTYRKGLHEVGNGVYAYLQPDGSWGWSNAGLVVDGDASLLVDTLFDLKLTREMLETMRKAIPAANRIGTVINTHANGDHCYGNELVADSEIISSRRTAEEMTELPPGQFAKLMALAQVLKAGGSLSRMFGSLMGTLGIKSLEALAKGGPFVVDCFGSFDFNGITLTLPTRTFDGRLELTVGQKPVHLIEVGPAHTRGDTLVYLPSERTVFTGDILFIEGHPIVWEGPVSNWIRACDHILAMDVEAVVPGHGPITTLDGVRQLKGYLEYLTIEARKRFDAGMKAYDAACDIALDAYASWKDRERIVVNVDTLYRDFRGKAAKPHAVKLFGDMARYHASQSATHARS